MALSKNSILKHAGVFSGREVHVPAWRDETGDDVVLVRGMTVREFEVNQARAETGKATASVIARCVVDPSGGRVFSDADIDQIAELPFAQIQAVSQAIVEESGLDPSAGDDAVDDAITRAEGNSAPTTGDEASSA